MHIALTGATGFIGRYILRRLAKAQHRLRCWHRPTSRRDGLEDFARHVDWIEGDLGDERAAGALVEGCDAVIHAALYHPQGGFRGGDEELLPFVEKNVLGTLRLIEAARSAGVPRFVFISTCAVHEVILSDRPLDEKHPAWSTHHYGAHKAAIEMFVHSFGLGMAYDICALRPTGVYGLAHPAEDSKWFELVRRVVRGETVDCRRGGKEVHAADVARAAELLLTADDIAGQAYNCCDMYVSEYDVATLARKISGSRAEIRGGQTQPKHQIATGKIRSLGMEFGGRPLLEATIEQLVQAAT